jgi:AcrR family transcriptional regulator
MAPPRRTEPTSEKRQAVEAAVLAATEELLAEGASFADLNIERIATRSGISRTAFYFYFRDKRELLMRVTEGVSELLFTEAEAWFSGDGGDDGAEELTVALRKIGVLYREHGALLRAIVEVSTYDHAVATFWRNIVGRFVEATRARIEAEQAAGRADPAIHPRPTAFALTWMSERTFYELLVQDDPVDPEEAVEALAAIWLRSVYARLG